MLDFETFSLVEPAFLVTIISEAVLKDSIVALLKNLKVKSYTVSDVQGEGRYARHLQGVAGDPAAGESSAETSVEVRAIVSQELSNVIFYALKEQKRDFAITAYRQPIEVLIDE